jgi:hypothetical protein
MANGTQIQNLGSGPLSLPSPISAIVPPGHSHVTTLGIATVITALGGAQRVLELSTWIRLSEVATTDPGATAPPVDTDAVGGDLTGTVGNATVAKIGGVAVGTAAILNGDTDGALVANSDARVATQKATKTAIATALAAAEAYTDALVVGLLDFKGATDCSGNPNYPAALKGDVYIVAVAGKIGGAAGTAVDIGDAYLAVADNAGGTEAGVGASWAHLEHNLIGATVAPLMDGVAAIGVGARYAREDHVHPTDTTLAPKASPTFTTKITTPQVELGAGLATVEYVIADPRTTGLDRAFGSTVIYHTGKQQTLLIKASDTVANGGNAYAWRRPNERYILPESQAAATGLLGLNLDAIYKPGNYVNSCPDLVGANHLTKSAVNGDVTQCLVDGHQAQWLGTTAATLSADVLDPALSSFWDAVVFTLPGGPGAFPTNIGIVTRMNGAFSFGYAAYWNGGVLNVVFKDSAGHSTGTLNFAAPTLSPQNDPGTLYLYQHVFDRANATLDFRLSKFGAAADTKAGVNVAALVATFTAAGQTFGYGAASTAVGMGNAVAWGTRAKGAQVEGANRQAFMATKETAMGFAA